MRKYKFLTANQRLVFDFVRQKIYNSFPPSIREVAVYLGVTGKAAHDYLWALRKKGYIHWEDNSARTISLLPPYKDDTRHSYVVKTDVPELGIQKGDFLLIDTGKPVAVGEVILSTQGQVKRCCAGDTAFGKVMGISRPID